MSLVQLGTTAFHTCDSNLTSNNYKWRNSHASDKLQSTVTGENNLTLEFENNNHNLTTTHRDTDAYFL
jgi:hypothetical protein